MLLAPHIFQYAHIKKFYNSINKIIMLSWDNTEIQFFVSWMSSSETKCADLFWMAAVDSPGQEIR